ncbi:MAG: hypothetical protein J3K34DRAFT_396417 [Monoraphidium minutum]|nr:MAG: hypothetical protein J3K34DRAFT_396417 [Monoraphidium minutum]
MARRPPLLAARAAALLGAAAVLLLLLTCAPAADAAFSPVVYGTYTAVCPFGANPQAGQCPAGRSGTYTITVYEKASYPDMAPTVKSAANAFWSNSTTEAELLEDYDVIGAVFEVWGAGAPTTNGIRNNDNANLTVSAMAPFTEIEEPVDPPERLALVAFRLALENDPSQGAPSVEGTDVYDAVKLVSFATATFISDGGGGEGFNGAAYEFCGAALGPQCHGRPFNLLSEARHQFNAEVNRHHATGDRDEFPAAGSWCAAPWGWPARAPCRAAAAAVAAAAAGATRLHAAGCHGPKTRALHPSAGGGAGAFRELLQSVQVNGADAMARVGSGETQVFEGGVSLHWPAARHEGDVQDGPVAVITTPDTTWTWYLESEDTWHLDFKVSIRAGARLGRAHGLLGQSLEWGPDTPAVVEGGDDLQYALANGLLGTAFEFNAFTGARRTATSTKALRILAGAARAAGTPAAIARGK